MDESAYSTLLKYVENTEYTENLRQYDTFVALAIAFNLGRNNYCIKNQYRNRTANKNSNLSVLSPF